jgi:D-alanyl-D-alanine carboxypeptidase
MVRGLFLFLALGLAACSSTAGGGDDPPSTPADPAPPPPADPPPPDPTTVACDAVRAALAPAVDSAQKTSGGVDVAVGVSTKDCPFVSATSGASKLAPDALYRIASITKTYTSAVILHFVATGAVGLDETIARFALGVPNETTITVRQLLDHTSGIFDYTQDPDFVTHLDWTPAERIAVAAKHAPYNDPGASFHYSNTNFVALGLVAEKLGGAPIATLVRSLVLAPRGLSATFFDGGENVTGTVAPSFKNGVPLTTGRFGAWADGAIVASLSDVTQWIHAYASGDASPTLVSDLQKGVNAGSGVSYGLALEILSPAVTGHGSAYGHGGDIPGFHSQAFWFPQQKWTITAIVNDDAADPNEVMLAVMDALAKAKK